MKRILLVIVVGLFGLTACAGAGSLGAAPGSPTPSTSPSASPTPSHTPKSPKPSPTKSEGGVSCATLKGGHNVGAQLVDVRVGRHDTYDRVTFEFSGTTSVPSFAIRAETNPTEDASGRPLNLAGTTYAEIVFQDASGYDLDGNPTYQGPSDFRPGFPVLAEAKAAGDFERVLSWAFGLNHSNCWKAIELSNPARLAIDFPHGN